jgi:hypothetical protein
MATVPENSPTRPRRRLWRWWYIAIAVVVVYATPRLIATLRFANLAHEPSVSGEFSQLDMLLPPASSTISRFHLGLPHNSLHSASFIRSVWLSFTKSYHGYLFHSEAWQPSPEFSVLTQRILTDKSTFRAYIGPKLCGGFHADFAVILNAPDGTTEFMVCLGCQEVLIFAPGGECIVELNEEPYRLLKEAWKQEQPSPEE